MPGLAEKQDELRLLRKREELSSLRMQSPEAKPSESEAILRGAAQGASFGLADEATAYAKALGTSLMGSIEPINELYVRERDKTRAAYKSAEKAHPSKYFVGEIGGGVASALLPIPGTGIAKLGKVGQAAATSALQGFGYSEADNAVDLASDVGISTGLGLGISGVGSSIGKGVKNLGEKTGATKLLNIALDKTKSAAEGLPKKILAAIGGVKEEVIDDYLANPAAVDAARPLTAIGPEVTERIQNLKEAVIEGSAAATEKIPAKGKIKTDQIQAGFKDILSQFKGSGGAGKEAKKARAAIKSLKNDFDNLVADQVPKKVSSPLLGPSGQPISELFPEPTASPQTVELRSIKKFIKNLDKEIKVASDTGAFSSPENVAKVELRGVLDQVLKAEVPAYREAMIEVAAKTSALKEASKKFGKGDVAQKLQTAGRRENQQGARQALEGLSSQTNSEATYGKDILAEVQNRLVQEAFTKDATRGSKGVNLGMALAGGAMAGVGEVTGIEELTRPGGGILGTGALIGALRDGYGPRVTKKILDAYITRGPDYQAAIKTAAKLLYTAKGQGPEMFEKTKFLVLKQFPQVEEMLETERNNSILPTRRP